MPDTKRWFTTTFTASVEVSTEDEATALFRRAQDAIGEVFGGDRAWSVLGGKPTQDADDAVGNGGTE